jgi:hypothetical protein
MLVDSHHTEGSDRGCSLWDCGFDLQECIDEFRDEMPKGALIIGSDPGAAMFILGTSPPLVGVYFWDHQHRFTGSSEESGNTFKLAPTFTAWLEKLRDPQEPDQ